MVGNDDEVMLMLMMSHNTLFNDNDEYKYINTKICTVKHTNTNTEVFFFVSGGEN